MSHATAPGDLLRRNRVLVVDDQRDAADAQALILETLGQQVWRAYDGVEALRMARSVQPQIVLMDLQMPVITGIDVARLMRGLASLKDTRLIAYTGSSAFGDDVAILNAGFDAVLRKPADVQDLLAVLRHQQPRPG